MAKQSINIGSSANDKTGDPLRTAFNKINENFTELYGASPFGQQVTISGNQISANESNADLVLSGSGTGGVVASAVRIDGTSLSSSDSTQINVNENLDVGGNITASGNITATGDIFANGNINLGNASSDQTKVVGVFEADNIQIDGTTITTNTTNGSVTITGNATGGVVVENLTINDNTISSPSNSDIVIEPGGTGDVVLSALRINGTTLDSSDSSAITLGEAVDITGALTGTSGSFSTTLAVTGATTLTGATTINNSLTANSVTTNTIASNGSNADLSIQPSGTGDVLISALRINGTTLDSSDSSKITVAEQLDVTGTLVTADITTTGTHTITGQSDIDFVRIKDHSITTNDSNANLNLSANGTGTVTVDSTMTTGDVNTTGDIAITGRLDVDNIAIDGNGIIATNSGGDININPNATGQVTIGGSNVSVPSMLSASTLFAQTEILLATNAKIRSAVTNSDIILETEGTGSVVLEEVSITANKITTHVSNADLQLDTDGTGLIDILTDTQSTVGSSGSASAPPGQPTGYIKVKIAGTTRVIPFYDQA
tara:strand:- start:4905 stop:6548 length:1644 start_codon:yes stop_codon:yes gene_type:complete